MGLHPTKLFRLWVLTEKQRRRGNTNFHSGVFRNASATATFQRDTHPGYTNACSAGRICLENSWVNFDKIWFGSYATGGYSKLVFISYVAQA